MAKKKNLVGQKFGKLTIISEAIKQDPKNTRAIWNCVCDCGETIIVTTNHLTTGNTKSCGCLKIDAIKQNQKLSLPIITKYKSHITSARKLWRQYCYEDKKCNLSFENWLNLTQKNCSYCGAVPFTIYNIFLKKKNASQQAKDNGNFIYNGIDRIDNSKPHTIDNVVPCCQICNRAKNTLSIDEFKQYISNLKIEEFVHPNILLKLPIKYLLVSLKCAFRHYKRNYGTMEIDLQTFYTYSQLPCHYCGTEKSNYFNVYLKDKKASQTAKDGAHFYYNGIDRVNNNLGHTPENCVPCCINCNFAKSDMTFIDFQNWIKRIKEHQNKKSIMHVT